MRHDRSACFYGTTTQGGDLNSGTVSGPPWPAVSGGDDGDGVIFEFTP